MEAPDGHPATRANRQLALVCVTDFTVWLGTGAIYPYLPVFLNEQARASVALVGVIAAAYFVGVFAFAPAAGRLSDRVGRKPLMVAGTALYVLATLLFLTTTDPYLFIVFRFLEGVGTAAIVPAAQSFIAEITDDSNRSSAYGWLTTAQFAGLIAGPALAWPLYQLAGGQGVWAFYSIFVFGAAITGVAVVALALFLREPPRAARERERRAAQGAAEERPAYRSLLSRPVVALIAIAATAEFAMGGFEVVWSIWLRDIGFSMSLVGATFIAFSVPMLLSFLGGRAADHYSRFWLVVAGFGIEGLCWIVFPMTHRPLVIFVFLAISGLAFAFGFPAKQAFLVQVSPRRWLGTIQGLEQSTMQLAALVGTLLTPLLYQLVGGWVFGIAGAVSLLGVVAAAPTLHHEWACVLDGDVTSCADAERRAAVAHLGPQADALDEA